MNRLTIIGSVNPFSGYGRHLIRAAQDIEALTGTMVGIRPLKLHPNAPQFVQERYGPPTDLEWELIIAPPTVCPTAGKRTVYFTMNETTRLNNTAIHCMQLAEHIIVPNLWNKDCFLASGAFEPIHVVPLGIDHRIFNWRPLPPPSPVIFGTAGSGPRKGIPDVIRAFLQAFPGRKDVRLRIKVTTEDEAPDVVDPRIDVVRANYTDEQMADWYASLHCFVSASRGEGWGLMQQEACAMGRGLASAYLPGMSWTGKEPTNRLADAPSPYVGQWYSGPDLRSFSMVLQDAASDFLSRRVVSNTDAEEFTWDRSIAELIRVLKEVGAIKFHCGLSNKEGPIEVGKMYKAEQSVYSLAETMLNVAKGPALAIADKSKALAVPKYYHSGNLGDIIYGLHAIREHCGERGAELIIGPCQHQTGALALKMPITKLQYDMLLPLLRTQKWIKRVRWSQFYPIAEEMHDMNGFRKVWGQRHTLGIKTLCEAQFEHLGIRDKFQQSEWLELWGSEDRYKLGRIIIHRSARWRQDDEMWRKLLARHRKDVLFVGLTDEYFEFENMFGPVSFWKVSDFLEMARLIADNVGCVMNQSFPCALAVAMGQRVFQEQSLATPDCTFDRPGSFWTQKDDVRQVVKGWLE